MHFYNPSHNPEVALTPSWKKGGFHAGIFGDFSNVVKHTSNYRYLMSNQMLQFDQGKAIF